jgi:hypothetical protein
VTRWFIFKPKIPICVNFGGSGNGRCWYILCPFGEFSGHLAYFTAIWYIFRRFGTFLPILVCCTENNLATLQPLTNPADIFFLFRAVAFLLRTPRVKMWRQTPLEYQTLIIQFMKDFLAVSREGGRGKGNLLEQL